MIGDEIWYWPYKDQMLHGFAISRKNLIMFFSEEEYYFHPISRKSARNLGMIYLGKLEQ